MPPYFARLLEMQATYSLSVFDLDEEERWGEWEDVLEEEARRYEPLPWDTFEVLILPDLQYQRFLNENGILWEQSPAAIPECVMVLPLFAEDEKIIGGAGCLVHRSFGGFSCGLLCGAVWFAPKNFHMRNAA